MCTYQDEWVWPKKNEDYLFPALREDAELQRRNKATCLTLSTALCFPGLLLTLWLPATSCPQDVVSAAIRRIRKSYTPPATCSVKISNIRSHSGRQRSINDLKLTNVKSEVGKSFARITTDSVWESYGRLTENQVAESLLGNASLQQLWQTMY